MPSKIDSSPIFLGVAVSVELCHGGRHHAARVIENLFSVPSADNPSWHVLHQLALLLTIYPQRLEDSPVRLCQNEGFAGDPCFSHLEGSSVMEPLKVLENEIPGSAPGYVGSEPGDARRRLWTNRFLPI